MTRDLAMYRRFHSQEPRKVGQFHRDLVIPNEMCQVGDAKNVLYRSDKLNPTTGEDEGWIDYIHDHATGVKVYVPLSASSEDDGPVRAVPVSIRRVSTLTWLGDCLGFDFKNLDGKIVKAKGTGALPELYTIPSGKALLVIQGKRRLLAMLWGGRLGVEHRGIVH